MKVLICVATELEASLLRERVPEFPNARMIVTGVGPVNAAYAATVAIMEQTPDTIVVCGVGGAYPSSGLQVGEVVSAEVEIYGDLGAQSPAGFLDMKALGFPVVASPAPLFNEIPMQIFPTKTRARFVTVSTCTGTDQSARDLEARTRGGVENMEGAAVAHVAHLHRIPVGEVRGISNIVTNRDTKSWRLKDAAIAAQEAVIAWLETVSPHPAPRKPAARKPVSPLVNFAFSPCPNDTFAFHAIVHGLVPGISVTPHLDDIEALNVRAAGPDAEVTKVSINAYGHGLRDRYLLLRAGGAAGFGVGPIIVAKSKRDVGGRIAIPGKRTTAALLLRQLGRFETVVMRFDQIEDAVLRGDADCGVLIHEGRFTYQARGLTLLIDLGEVWEQRMHCPLPLAAIAIRRDLAPALAPEIDRALRASVEYAFAHPEASRQYVAAHAQEMDPGVTERHIQLYVNDYTVAIDEAAVMKMLEWGEQEGVFLPADKSLPIFA